MVSLGWTPARPRNFVPSAPSFYVRHQQRPTWSRRWLLPLPSSPAARDPIASFPVFGITIVKVASSGSHVGKSCARVLDSDPEAVVWCLGPATPSCDGPCHTGLVLLTLNVGLATMQPGTLVPQNSSGEYYSLSFKYLARLPAWRSSSWLHLHFLITYRYQGGQLTYFAWH